MLRRLFPVSVMCLCLLNSLSWAQGFYFEAESVKAPSPWREATSVTGYSGKCYLHWGGGDQTGKPNVSAILAYEFQVQKEGFYHVQVRGRRDRVEECQGAAGDLCNDLFSKMNDTPWRKTMVDGSWGTWVWMGRLYYDGSNHTAIFPLKAGKNTFYVTGRSKGVKFDAVRIYYEKTTPPTGPVTSNKNPAQRNHRAREFTAQTKWYSIDGREVESSGKKVNTSAVNSAGRRNILIGSNGSSALILFQ